MGAGGQLLVRLWRGVHNARLIVLIPAGAGRTRMGQQDELREAMKVGHIAESLQHEHHGDQAQEEVGCRGGGGRVDGLGPYRTMRRPHPWSPASHSTHL